MPSNKHTNKMKDLTAQEGRIAEVESIENSFLEALRSNGFDIAPDAVCTVNDMSIELGIASNGTYKEKGFKMTWASEISLYCIRSGIFGRRENEINFGSSGAFTPENKASYWRTIHAASILKNWTVASEIVNKHCKMYGDIILLTLKRN